MDEVLASDFLETARTAKEIADHIKVGGRKKTVKTIPGTEWGGSVNKYVLREFWKG